MAAKPKAAKKKAAKKKVARKKAAKKKVARKKAAKKKVAKKKVARKKAVPKATTSARRTGPVVTTTAGAGGVTIRHYCQGIGDCHLLKFKKDDGTFFWMLIDCGVHSAVTGGSAFMDKVVADVATLTNKLDVIVGTHEHTDHLSAFSSAADKFKDFQVGEIWMGWTENPKDPQARALDKYKTEAVAALQKTTEALTGHSGGHLGAIRDGLMPLLQFQFGAKGDKVRAMRDDLVKLAPKNVRYFEPKDEPMVLPDVPNLRIYVLGPPRDPALIKIVDRPSDMYGLAGAGSPVARALLNGFAVREKKKSLEQDDASPFDGHMGEVLSTLETGKGKRRPPGVGASVASLLDAHYFGPAKGAKGEKLDQAWRRIDMDWLGVSAGLGMQLDSKTNNTSLVLAFEFVDTGRVLLFTGDAQVGNWLGWQNLKWNVDGKTVTGPDLLARTVYYKVGHHGSGNATLKQKGLELMNQADFSAFIPTNKKDAVKVKWGRMPLDSLFDDLKKHADGRVIRADDPWVATATVDPRFSSPSGSIKAVRNKASLWVELDIN